MNSILFQTSNPHPLLVFSHLRWDFVFQRPQQLMSAFSQMRVVYFIEQPIFSHIDAATIELSRRSPGLVVAVPHLPEGCSEHHVHTLMRILLDEMIANERIENYTVWYTTPQAISFTDQLIPEAIIYDCQEELNTPSEHSEELLLQEDELFELADLVFTETQFICELKKDAHPAVYCLPCCEETTPEEILALEAEVLAKTKTGLLQQMIHA